MSSFMDKIKIFYDGTNITKYGYLYYISGFTTNTTFMVQGNELNYPEFYKKNSEIIGNKPISLQVFKDIDIEIYNDAKIISAYGENVYVKIPIIKSDGSSNINIIKTLIEEGIKVNITAIFTESQLLTIYSSLKDITTTPIIVSIFAGRISDTSTDPNKIITFGCKLFKENKNVEILWAGCKENLSIQHAIDCGCHIITIPDSIIDRLTRVGTDLTDMSIMTAANFNNDGKKANITN